MTRLVLLGWPARHSLSPVMQNAALGALGLPYEYAAVEVPPERLHDRVVDLKNHGFLGGNVTVPHKQAVVPMCDEIDALAAGVGAVNTLVHRDGRLLGFNTDVEGVRHAVAEAGIGLSGVNVVVLGSGGAARAVVAATRGEGASVTVVARDPRSAARWAPEAIPWRAGPLSEALADAGLMVNASSAGTDGASPPCEVPVERLPAHAVVADLVYSPLETHLLGRARARGLRTIHGLRMLLYQGAASFRRWTDREPPVDVMERALLAGTCR